jgi:hypothetical protein
MIYLMHRLVQLCPTRHEALAHMIASLVRPAISLSSKHTNLGPLLEVEMSKKCTPLWREAHLEVKSVKN